MHLFIDTNVLLSFFHFTSDDLEELRKLSELLRDPRHQLWLPDQVVQEFRRNRDKKIDEALKRFREQKVALAFPQMCKDYPQYAELQRLQRDVEANHARLLGRLVEDVANEDLKADAVVKELFERSTRIASSDEIVAAARLRVELGNPPGKQGSLGDAVNWEALLHTVPPGEDIAFVTDDKDFSSALDEGKFNSFLAQEWYEHKASSVQFYRRISSFFRERFPAIRLASEVEKEIAIADLRNSGNFRRTHSIVAKLAAYNDFTATQAEDIAIAAVENPQVHWIIGDPDVRGLLTMLLERYGERLTADTRAKLAHALPAAAQ